MCTAAFDPTNPNSLVRRSWGREDLTAEERKAASDFYEDPTENGRIYVGVEAEQHRYLDNKAAAEAREQEKETLAKRAAYTTQFDAISADARGIRQRYAQSLGYNPYFLR